MPVFIGDYRCFPALHERYKALHKRYKNRWQELDIAAGATLNGHP
jgi:hypothetical protein